jgi:hypothetical protein
MTKHEEAGAEGPAEEQAGARSSLRPQQGGGLGQPDREWTDVQRHVHALLQGREGRLADKLELWSG